MWNIYLINPSCAFTLSPVHAVSPPLHIPLTSLSDSESPPLVSSLLSPPKDRHRSFSCSCSLSRPPFSASPPRAYIIPLNPLVSHDRASHDPKAVTPIQEASRSILPSILISPVSRDSRPLCHVCLARPCRALSGKICGSPLEPQSRSSFSGMSPSTHHSSIAPGLVRNALYSNQALPLLCFL